MTVQELFKKGQSDAMRTPNPNCPGCRAYTRHTDEEMKKYHPYAGHGYIRGQGWSHPDLDPEKGGKAPR